MPVNLRKGFTDLPVMPEGIDDAADSPAIRLVHHRPQSVCAGSYGPVEDGIRILDDHTIRTVLPPKVAGLKFWCSGDLVGKPEIAIAQRQLRDD